MSENRWQNPLSMANHPEELQRKGTRNFVRGQNVAHPGYLIRLVEVKVLATYRARTHPATEAPWSGSGENGNLGLTHEASLQSDSESDGLFQRVDNLIWCTALACGQMATHNLPRVVRDLVLDYWHGPMAGFTNYDEIDITRWKHKALINEFKENIRLILDSKKDSSRFWLEHILDSSHDCCRFLMARDFNVVKAVKLLMEAIEKREELKLDEAIFRTMPRYPRLKECLPSYHQGFDDGGRMVFIRSLRLMDAKKTVELFSRDDLFKTEALYNEFAQRVFVPTYCRIRGQVEWRSHAIIDMEGVGVGTLLDRKFRSIYTANANIIQTCYPENMGVCSIIRAPLMFSTLWYVIKGITSKRTQNKISVDSSNDPARTLHPRFQQSTSLPQQYGGQAINTGPQYLNSELESIFHSYVTGKRDIREIIPNNSEYSFIPIYKTNSVASDGILCTRGTSRASSLRQEMPPLSFVSTSTNSTGLRARSSKISRITSEPVGFTQPRQRQTPKEQTRKKVAWFAEQ